ncbi:error-prone DNA polymerase [Rhodoferax sp.]|uniref:error-prone DNA polymerase n=1 Tax=Rhodoferax sp. TaxID=50421 RepID=UPI00283D3DE8|nr:error-prone DNA polymerase [Rhodoferax sp.]MDR3370038.1 error-prone DNA polymerase [Rhodoferax sp.]
MSYSTNVQSPKSPTVSCAYAELHCLSNFSFQRGASNPEELVARAHALGYAALALTDECSVAGVVRAHLEAKKCGLKLLPGAEFLVPLTDGLDERAAGVPAHDAVAHMKHQPPSDGFRLIALPRDQQAWGDLCEFITLARRSAPKGQYCVRWPDPSWAGLHGSEVLLSLPYAISLEAACALCIWARGLFGIHLWLTVTLLLRADDALQLHKLQQLSQLTGVPLLAAGGVLMHVRSRKPLQDVITAVRHGQPVSSCGYALQANAENHLRSRERLVQIYPPELLANTLTVAARCTFSLDELRYQYPMEAVLPGQTPAQTLRQFTYEGTQQRYSGGLPESVRQQLEHELALITELRYEMYFLTVHDIVAFARRQGILCQGRGSAANSAVCYCLGITEVDPARSSVLFERFISRERNEPPDIDVDFEHQRREEVIQYIYAKYGRDRAALTAVVTSYRPRSALRDVGRALGIDEALITAMAKEHPGMYSREVLAERLQAALARVSESDPDGEGAGPSPFYARREGRSAASRSSHTLALWLDLSRQLQGFPRHLSQHPGGFVLTQGPLTRLVPVENAAMPERSIVQWDKDNLDAMGLLKVDVLALGMLSAIRRCLELVSARRGLLFRMQDIPAEDPATFDMICAADTVGVFQIESRAQMSMLPRLKPRCFYDLVIEVAIVRPGPIQGGMVHPYLKAREHPDQVVYPNEALETALVRTLGIPIFQEQVMQIAMIAANFTPGEADDLRRSMAAWKRKGGVHKFHDRLVNQMVHNGYEESFAESIFKQIEGFGEYGFPESHAASFALLTYVSCWLKWHEPACFLAAMLNSQPMGFYGPSQLVQDAKRHGVVVLPVDVTVSDWDCTLDDALPHVRLGLRLVSSLSEAAAKRISEARQQCDFSSTEDLALRAALEAGDLNALASADALASLSGHRRQQVWDASALQRAPELLREAPVNEALLVLPPAPEGEEVRFDYASIGLTLRSHPLSMLRRQLSKMKLMTATQLCALPHGRLVRACGLVTMRQSPGTAKGVTFVTLEDETGTVNVIVWKALKERQRSELLHARLLAVHGTWQRDEDSGGQVCHVVAGYLRDLTPLLGELMTSSRDFH